MKGMRGAAKTALTAARKGPMDAFRERAGALAFQKKAYSPQAAGIAEKMMGPAPAYPLPGVAGKQMPRGTSSRAIFAKMRPKRGIFGAR